MSILRSAFTDLISINLAETTENYVDTVVVKNGAGNQKVASSNPTRCDP